MAANDRHRLRHKGIETEPLARAEILARLREGRLTLAHAIEVGGRWVTLRQHLAGNAAVAAARGQGNPPSPPGEIPPPPPGAGTEPAGLDAVIRSGYIWCGLTFGLPCAVTGLPWFFRSSLGLEGAAGSFALLVVSLATVGVAHARARAAAARIEGEGLGDIAASLRNLALGLGLASGLLWTLLTLLA
jgi:hypothetical protein